VKDRDTPGTTLPPRRANREAVAVVTVAFLRNRGEHRIGASDRREVRQRDNQVAVAPFLGQQSSGRVVDRQHLLARRQLGGRAPRRIRNVLPFFEVVAERVSRDLEKRVQVVVDPRIQRPGEKHVDQPTDGEQHHGERRHVEHREPGSQRADPHSASRCGVST